MRLGWSIQRPPVIKEPPIIIALSWGIFAVSNFTAGLTFYPSLAVTVFGILDVLAGMEKRIAIKAPIDISSMWHVVPGDDSQEPVVFSDIHLAAIVSTCTPIR